MVGIAGVVAVGAGISGGGLSVAVDPGGGCGSELAVGSVADPLDVGAGCPTAGSVVGMALALGALVDELSAGTAVVGSLPGAESLGGTCDLEVGAPAVDMTGVGSPTVIALVGATAWGVVGVGSPGVGLKPPSVSVVSPQAFAQRVRAAPKKAIRRVSIR